VRPAGAVLDLSPGCAVVLDGRQWTVERRIPHLGQVLLTDPDGRRQQVTFQFLLTHPRCFTSSRTAATGANRGRQEATAADLHPGKRKLAELRMTHVLEMRTGFRSGSRLRPRPGEPKPEYNPDTTTLTQRRHAKLAELMGIEPEQARLTELDQVSFRTLVRWDLGEQNAGIVGCADHRWLRESGGRPSITENVREAILSVRQESLHRARLSMREKYFLVCQHMRDTCGSADEVPSYRTLVRVWREWFGAGGARQRNARSAELPATKHGHIVISRPGQVVALDTTVLPVMVRDGTFGEPVTVHLTLGLDVYTHSLVAFRLTLVSDKSVDVAMLLRDIMMPLPMRPGWGPEMAWPYPGIPAAVIADLAGYEPAGLPYFAPETVTTDHGSVYKNHALREAERVLGCNILPARKLRPQDKGAVERAFGVIRQLLLGKLPGYTGVDVADRGADPEGDACLTVQEMEHLIASWIVGIWQDRVLHDCPPFWDPDGTYSPNVLVAAAFRQAGLALEVPRPELFYELLPAHHVTINEKRGVKIKDLWYDDPDVLVDEYRKEQSSRGGRYKKRWVIRRDPRDRRQVYFQDPFSHQWHPLPWRRLPEDGNVPAFADARVDEALKVVRDLGMKPLTDADLLPVLLDLIGAAVPVSQWPGNMTKAQRTARAREIAQAAAAAADRPPGPCTAPRDITSDEVTVPTRKPRQPQTAEEVVTAERRRRGEGPPPGPLKVPGGLGASFWEDNPFVPPRDDDEERPEA
jgi:transposase InsO family protein